MMKLQTINSTMIVSAKISSKGRYIFFGCNRIHSSLIQRITFKYLTPIDKPIMSLHLNSTIELAAESMYFGFNDWGVSP